MSEQEQPVCRDCEEPVDPNEIYEQCPGCGAEHTAGSLRRDDEGRVRCPECEDSVLMDVEDLRRALGKSDKEAASHGANYAAGMRLSRSIIEGELLEQVREANPRREAHQR